MKRSNLIAGAFAALVAGYFIWWVFLTPDFVTWHRFNAENRTSLLKVRESIRLGDGYEDVLRAYWQHASSELRLVPVSPKTWSVSMPHEILAMDWVMYIDFSNGKVSAIKVRTSDGPPPPGAPADISGQGEGRRKLVGENSNNGMHPTARQRASSRTIPNEV